MQKDKKLSTIDTIIVYGSRDISATNNKFEDKNLRDKLLNEFHQLYTKALLIDGYFHFYKLYHRVESGDNHHDYCWPHTVNGNNLIWATYSPESLEFKTIFVPYGSNIKNGQKTNREYKTVSLNEVYDDIVNDSDFIHICDASTLFEMVRDKKFNIQINGVGELTRDKDSNVFYKTIDLSYVYSFDVINDKGNAYTINFTSSSEVIERTIALDDNNNVDEIRSSFQHEVDTLIHSMTAENDLFYLDLAIYRGQLDINLEMDYKWRMRNTISCPETRVIKQDRNRRSENAKTG